jgi:hypothetical protein
VFADPHFHLLKQDVFDDVLEACAGLRSSARIAGFAWCELRVFGRAGIAYGIIRLALPPAAGQCGATPATAVYRASSAFAQLPLTSTIITRYGVSGRFFRGKTGQDRIAPSAQDVLVMLSH